MRKLIEENHAKKLIIGISIKITQQNSGKCYTKNSLYYRFYILL